MNPRRPEVTNESRRFDEIGADRLASTPPRLAFGPFVLDPESGRLAEGDRGIPLAPRPFETLLFLARRPGRVVSKNELISTLWPETFVTDDVLVQCVVDIRHALGDNARSPAFVQTIPRRGYQFISPVRELPPEAGPPPPDRAGEPALASPSPAPAAHDIPDLPAPAASPFPGWLLGAGALGFGLALIVGGWWAIRRPSPGLPVTSVAAVEPGSLLVLPVQVPEATDESRWLREGVAEILRSELGQKPGFRIVPRHRLAPLLEQSGFREAHEPSTVEALALARALGAERVVTGTFVRIGRQFVLSTQLVQAATGQTEAELVERGVFPGELLTALADLGFQIAGHAPADTGPGKPVRLATRSVAAYREYAEAIACFARGGRAGAEEAERHLDAAAGLDPEFAYAFLKKAEIQQWRRRLGYGEPDPVPALQKAVALARQLPERERLLVETMKAVLLDGAAETALARGQDLLRLYPGYAEEVGLPRFLADVFYQQGRWSDIIALGQAHADSPSLPGPEKALLSALLAKAFRQMGELDRALLQARRALALWPSREGPAYLRQRVDLGRLCLDAGARPEALVELRAVALAREADVANLTDTAWGLYMAGEPAEAEALVGRALGLDGQYGNAYHLRGWLRLARQDWKAAALDFEQAYARTPKAFGAAHLGFIGGDIAALYYAGIAHQQAGDAALGRVALERVVRLCADHVAPAGVSPAHDLASWEAASYLALASARLGRTAPEPPPLRGDDATYLLQSARLHALLGRRDAALRELRQALALAAGERQHVADDPNFAALRTDPDFRALVGS